MGHGLPPADPVIPTLLTKGGDLQTQVEFPGDALDTGMSWRVRFSCTWVPVQDQALGSQATYRQRGSIDYSQGPGGNAILTLSGIYTHGGGNTAFENFEDAAEILAGWLDGHTTTAPAALLQRADD